MKFIKFKEDVKHIDIYEFTPRMASLFFYVVWYFIDVLKKDAIVTSLKSDRQYRSNDVHQYGRGADFRTHHLTAQEKTCLLNAINCKFIYGRGYNCAMIHGDAEHLHLQVPNNKFDFKII